MSLSPIDDVQIVELGLCTGKLERLFGEADLSGMIDAEEFDELVGRLVGLSEEINKKELRKREEECPA